MTGEYCTHTRVCKWGLRGRSSSLFFFFQIVTTSRSRGRGARVRPRLLGGLQAPPAASRGANGPRLTAQAMVASMVARQESRSAYSKTTERSALPVLRIVVDPEVRNRRRTPESYNVVMTALQGGQIVWWRRFPVVTQSISSCAHASNQRPLGRGLIRHSSRQLRSQPKLMPLRIQIEIPI